MSKGPNDCSHWIDKQPHEVDYQQRNGKKRFYCIKCNTPIGRRENGKYKLVGEVRKKAFNQFLTQLSNSK